MRSRLRHSIACKSRKPALHGTAARKRS
jgi:hypothetical protein